MIKMDPAIRQRWTAALRSGDYDQGTLYLRQDDKFCCLGVLCDLAEKDGIVTSGVNDPDGIDGLIRVYGDEDTQLLPPEVAGWAGMERQSPEVGYENDVGLWSTDELTALNDDEAWGFARIADAIEAERP
jgi:hypothetical protein